MFRLMPKPNPGKRKHKCKFGENQCIGKTGRSCEKGRSNWRPPALVRLFRHAAQENRSDLGVGCVFLKFMRIERIELRHLQVPLKEPFESNCTRYLVKDCVLVKVYSDGMTGFAESVARPGPFYSSETVGTVWHILRDFLIPRVLATEILHPDQVAGLFGNIRGNKMATAALEGAIWDLWCRQNGISLSKALGGTRREIEVGVSLGIEPTVSRLLQSVHKYVDQGYKRIKIKIKPGYDVEYMRAVREEFGNSLPLMADANSAYTLRDLPLLEELDGLGLMMIEQPLAYDDIIDHSVLQQALKTPICLDESIHSLEDARKAVELGSCQIINIKIGRVGGLLEARRIHDWCARRGIPVWCGGMTELGVGRAHNIALASLPYFSLPGDTSASHRSFNEDIVDPPIDFLRPGVLAVPQNPGLGFEVIESAVRRFTLREEVLAAPSVPVHA